MDFLNSGIILGLMGYFGYLIKDIPAFLESLLIQYKSCSIQVTSKDFELYHLTISWLLEQCPNLKKHVQYVSGTCTIPQIADGSYYFKLNSLTFIAIHKMQAKSQLMNIIVFEINITIFGKDYKKFYQDYQTYIINNSPDISQFLNVTYIMNGHTENKLIVRKSFDDIFFKQKNEILQILNNFIQNQNYYNSHGIIYKTGILLYGPPGSGKSSIARAIASYLDWDIYYINMQSNNRLPIYFENNTVFILEDIDCLVATRNNMDDEKLSLHEILNFIDGIISPHNAIFVATTNYLDHVDSALIRPGRFDYIFEVPYMDKDLALEMCKRFNVNNSILEDIKFPVSPAIIQNKIFKKINLK